MNDETYQLHANTLVRNVHPEKDINYLVNLFMRDASINMGNDFSDETLDRVIYITKKQFGFMPVCYVASAFAQGSLGKFGAGRLIPRTVLGWLTESFNEYEKKLNHEKYSKQPDGSDPLDVTKLPAGKATLKKADWLYLGIINEDEYDRIPLMEVAERIGKGMDVVPELWGIKSRKPKN